MVRRHWGVGVDVRGRGLGGGGWRRGDRGRRVSRPQPAHAATVVTLTPWQGWQIFGGAHWASFVQSGLRHFEQANCGLRVRLTGTGGAGSLLPAILAGAGPDVFQDWALAPYLEAGAVLDLVGYLRRDNVPLGLWSPGQMRAMRVGGGVFFLPCYIHVDVMAINLDALDTLGLQYPAPDWSYHDAARLYTAATRRKAGQTSPGVHLHFAGNTLGAPQADLTTYLLHGFGGGLMDRSRTRCTLGDAATVAAVQWVDELYWSGAAGGTRLDLAHTPFQEIGSNALLAELQTWGTAFRWTYFPVPRYPADQSSFEATDYHAVNAGSRNPEAAWRLIRFLSADPWRSRWAMTHLLRAPSPVALREEYVARVESVAPVARGKGLRWFVEAARHWGVANRVFRYQEIEAATIANAALAQAFSHQQSVSAALRGAARQIDALLASAAHAPQVGFRQRVAAAARHDRRLQVMFAGGRSAGGRP